MTTLPSRDGWKWFAVGILTWIFVLDRYEPDDDQGDELCPE